MLNSTSDALSWRPLRLLCLYRLVVALLLFGSAASSRNVELSIDVSLPALFFYASSAYLALAFIVLGIAVGRRPRYPIQVLIGTSVDIILITLLIHGAGGIEAGLGVLMVVAVAGGSLLMGARFGSFFAALATLAMLGEHMSSQLAGNTDVYGYTRVGFLGLATFATALGGAFLARRARENEALATRRGIDVANLEALNAHIVQRLETGVVAVDTAGLIHLTNSVSRRLLGNVSTGQSRAIASVSPGLAQAYNQWRETWETDESPVTDEAGGAEYIPRFQPLGPHGASGTLIFLENVTQMRAQVQQAKLASLGRLTASIAHEVRNPLGAILQAGQLLGESDYLERGDRRLVEIIAKQGRRMNETIENILQLSRRAPPNWERVSLDTWSRQVADEWRENQGPRLGALAIETDLAPVTVMFDPGHLQQVVENLLRNAAEHGGREGQPPGVTITASEHDSGRGVLDIRDNGPGIDPAFRESLFEPFATGSPSGTGLGLYLARELCEANQARITLNTDVTDGACFRIVCTLAPKEGSDT